MDFLKERIEYDIDRSKVKVGDFVKVFDAEAKECWNSKELGVWSTGIISEVSSWVIEIRTANDTIRVTAKKLQEDTMVLKKLKVVEEEEDD